MHRVPSARTIARLMTAERDALSWVETITVAAIEESIPQLVEARDITDPFHVMLQKKAVFSLEGWLEKARQSLVSSFACGVFKDIDAVRAAIASNWSNGQTEGQITKLKLVKRQMYGRAKLDLLEARLIAAATYRHQNCVRANFGRLSAPNRGQYCRPKHRCSTLRDRRHLRFTGMRCVAVGICASTQRLRR